jgi:hypothetical protein
LKLEWINGCPIEVRDSTTLLPARWGQQGNQALRNQRKRDEKRFKRWSENDKRGSGADSIRSGSQQWRESVQWQFRRQGAISRSKGSRKEIDEDSPASSNGDAGASISVCKPTVQICTSPNLGKF